MAVHPQQLLLLTDWTVTPVKQGKIELFCYLERSVYTTNTVYCIIYVFVVCFTSKEADNSAPSQASSSQSVHPAASESQHLCTPDTRAKTLSESLPQHSTPSAGSCPPSDTATKTHCVTSRESPPAPHGSPVASPPPLDSSQGGSGVSAASQKLSVDDDKDQPQTDGPSAGRRADSKEQHQSKPSFRGTERRYSRDRDRHYRDRSRERESDCGRQWFRRDSRDFSYYHRSNRDHLPSYNPNSRDRERAWHPRERDRDRCSHHYHHYHHQRSKEDWDREPRGRAHYNRKDSYSHRRWQQDSQDRSRGRERDYYPSKGETYSPESKGSPPRSTSGSASNKRTADDLSKEQNSEVHQFKKHKKSKKKKKSKDKDRHHHDG